MSQHFVEIGRVGDVPNGRHRAYQIDGHSVLVFQLNGQYFATSSLCTHLEFSLEGGRQVGWEIICRKHGARFDIRDGRALGGPVVNPLRSFEVRVTEGRIEIALEGSSA